MKWLAIDCSTDLAFIAIGEQKIDQTSQIEGVRRHSQTILTTIEQLFAEQQWHPSQLDAIILGRGPGSFTGIRVACSVVQGIALARDLPVYPVGGLHAIARQLRLDGETRPIIAAIDARMNEVYWSIYLTDAMIASDERVSKMDEIDATQAQTVLAGVGVEAYVSQLSGDKRANIVSVLERYPSLGAMLDLVNQQVIEPVDAARALPVYIRNQVTQGASGG